MKTRQQIQTEARELARLGGEYRAESLRLTTPGALVPASRELMRLPSWTPTLSATNAPSVLRVRSIDAVLAEHDSLLYRVVEREEHAANHAGARETIDVLLVATSAYEALAAGYTLGEEDRLAEQLGPYAERGERERSIQDNVDTIVEVEGILEADQLPHSGRLRTRLDVIDFLDGRMEANDLISRTLARQFTRDMHHEEVVEHHELRLTVEEV